MFQRCAVILLALFAGMSIQTARAASLQTLSPSQCVWQPGDNPGWSAPRLDDRGWPPLQSWKLTPGQTRMWVRCHANLVALHQASQPALLVGRATSAYELFFNGKLIGRNGNMGNGQASINAEHTFPIASGDLAPGTDTVALRMNFRRIADPPTFAAGEADWLRAERSSHSLAGAKPFLLTAIGFGVIGVLAFVLLAMYLNDRSHLELLLLAAGVMGLSVLRLSDFSAAALAPLPGWLYWIAHALGEAGIAAFVWFIFRLAGRRVPLAYKLFLIPALSWAVHDFFLALSPANLSQWSDALYLKWGPLTHLAGIAIATAPFAAFWPWRKIPKGIRAMAACAMLWGFMDIVWFAVILYYDPTGGKHFQQWRPLLLELRGIGTMAAIIALITLLFREHRRTVEERAVLAGEMHAAQQIQRILAPTAVDTAAGARVEVAFRPMRDVGGDFYLCRALPDGRQRILIGDVSGKGAAAAMTATLLIGAAERRAADSPAELLEHLNLVLHASQVGGFATCLCADLEPDGAMTIANAGHLSPYLHGEEMATPPGLPLGLTASLGIYEELRLHLAEEETLTFMSDGVVEARSETGELFGFERTQAVSAYPAEAIADAAEKYGQQDDITVLTLTRARTSAAQLATTAVPEMA